MLSHYPSKSLSQHIEETNTALQFLLSFHTEKLKSVLPRELLNDIIQFHDEGKKSHYFQSYIKDPINYSGDPALKSHSKLSALIVSVKYQNSPDQFFRILQCIGGHHTKLCTLKDLQYDWLDSDYILKKQLFEFPDINSTDIDKEYPADDINDLLEDDVEEFINGQSLKDAFRYRLVTQLLYSLLLESDKALLAVPDIAKHSEFRRNEWKKDWVDKKIGVPADTTINQLRSKIRKEVTKKLDLNSAVFTLTSPTGSGKTLLSATWALDQREKIRKKSGVIPKIIIVLPFLSIINQTVDEYIKLLKIGGVDIDGSWLIASHSLADRNYNDKLEDKEESFFIDTWRSDVIITTYDQFLYTIFSPKSKYQMRLHNLLDSIIVIDEVQSLPTKLWKPLEVALQNITEMSRTKVLLMSATLPGFVSNALPSIPDYKNYFQQFNRYELDFNNIQNNQTYPLEEFISKMQSELALWVKNKERVLITLNTRKSAQQVFLGIKNENPACKMFFISSDVIPADRLNRIYEIKHLHDNEPCIVVSTQSIEAGVDIDMTRVIRDFAPLDSLIQIAGRCNRSGNLVKPQKVEVYQLISNNKRLFCEMIYNKIHLQKTRQVLKNVTAIFEKNIISLTEHYFELLSGSVSTGEKYLEDFSYWRPVENIRSVLRGDEIEKYEFCLLGRNPELKQKIQVIVKIHDRWERREAWKRIAGEIAKLTVSVIAYSGFDPQDVANSFCGLWDLNLDYYDDDVGINIPVDNTCSSLIL